MASRATTLLTASLVAVLGLMLGVGTAAGQDAPSLGDEFIFFVNGPNVLIPATDATVVTDPLAPESSNKVARFGYGNWVHSGFRWDRTVGADLSAAVGESVGEGETLYLRLLSDPANAGKPNVWLMFTDKTDDSAASRDDILAGNATADHEFRLIWEIPQEMHDGQWHDLAIPLPPATLAALDSAKAGVNVDGSPLATPLDDLAANWSYCGAWSNGAYGVGPCFGVPDDPLFREFEWGNVKNFGVMFDNNTGGGAIYIDDMYVGDENTDVAVASDPAAPMSGVTFTQDGDANVISWNHQAGFGGYNVYVANFPIADVTSPGVSKLATVPFSAESFEVQHMYEVPHPALAPMQLYYAVTSLSDFGVENGDISNSKGELANPNLQSQPYIIQLTEAEGNQLFDDLSAGNVSGAGFPEGLVPFRINQERGKPGDAALLPSSDDDLSAEIWMGYTDLNELFLYAEVHDDVLQFGGENNTGAETWQFDAIELGWGNYDVRTVPGGSVLLGSPHDEYGRGTAPDYQFRMAGLTDASGAIVATSTFVSNLDGGEGEVQGGGSIVDVMTDGSGATIGWKILTLIPLDAIQFDGTGDVVLDPPAADVLRLLPMNIALSDADGENREHQVLWSTKANAGANWWNTPSQWMTVAMAGRSLAVGTEDAPGELPFAFALEQNYPNPFNPSTMIRFSIAQPEAVTLSVYNVIGQRVATLIDGQVMAAGQYTVPFDGQSLASGLYLYRLEAGGSYVEARRMLLVK